MEPIRILYVNGGPMNRGGIESYMMNYYRHFNRNKIQVDFVSIGLEKAAYDSEIENLGGKVYYIPKKSKNYFGYIKGIRNILITGRYKIIHTHMDAMGFTVLREAKKINIPIRIAHSHNTQHLTKNFIKFRINEYARKNINKYATHMFACSDKAGRWLFGDDSYKKGKIKIIKNAIDVNKFIFNEKKRIELRSKFNITNEEVVIGHIGRFDYQKNHEFLLKLFKNINDKDNKYKLMLIGDGHLRDEIKNTINLLGIEDKVILVGVVDNTYDYYNVFDIFVLPSLFEGLPVVGIEAQANGLKCLFSDTITKEVNISSNSEFLSIKDIDLWQENICKQKKYKRNNNLKSIQENGYNISYEAEKLQKIYLNLI